MDTHARSVVKAVSYRLWGTIATFAIALVVTGRIELAAQVGLCDPIVKTVIFYLHERVWSRISFGRTKTPEYEI